MDRDAASECGEIVLGWLTRVIVVLTVVAIAAFDTIAIASAHLSATDDANGAAEAANAAWTQSYGNYQTAYNAAATYAEAHHDSLVPQSFTVATNGTVQLMLHRHANTLVVGHIGPLKKLADITGKGSATTPS